MDSTMSEATVSNSTSESICRYGGDILCVEAWDSNEAPTWELNPVEEPPVGGHIQVP